MSIYRVPYDFTHEEKVFGGYLSIRQMLYLVLAGISTSIFFIPVLPILIKVIIFLMLFVIFITFAFLKIGTCYADKYFISIIKYIFKKKTFI